MENNRIAVITGASGGLGKALVAQFAQTGWQVVGIGRSNAPANMPADARYEQFDASDAVKCEIFWNALQAEFPDAQICLVNNAGAYINGSLTETNADDYEQQMRSCYFSSVYMTRGLALSYKKARIINVVSATALQAEKGNAAYGAAKAAQKYFFQTLQQEFDPLQYQITNLYPQNIASRGPAKNAMTPEDLAIFVREQAEARRSYYLRDVTLYAVQ